MDFLGSMFSALNSSNTECDYNVGLYGEWDQKVHRPHRGYFENKEKDIRKARLDLQKAHCYKGYNPLVWITDKDTEDDKRIKLERQKKIDQLPMKKTVHINLELERADCSGCYRLTTESELSLAKLLRKEKFNILYSSDGFLEALDYYAPMGSREPKQGVSIRVNTWKPSWSIYNRSSKFAQEWNKYIEDGDLPDMSELFTRLMSTDEMKMILRKAAQEAGKDLDESQLNLLASNQDLAKAYVKPILDAMQAQQQNQQQSITQSSQQQNQQQSTLEQLAEQMLNIDVIQQRIRQSLSVAISDKEFAAMLQNQQFRESCIEDIIQGILKGDTSQTTSNSNGSKLDDLINPAPESQSEPDVESQQQDQTQTQPEQDQDQDQDQA